MKRKDNEGEGSEGLWTLVNSSSKHTDDRKAELCDSENTALPGSRGRVNQLSVTEHEDCEPHEEDLKRISQLIDGFKASKVIGVSHG